MAGADIVSSERKSEADREGTGAVSEQVHGDRHAPSSTTALESHHLRLPGAERVEMKGDDSEHLSVDADAHGVFLERGEVSARQRVVGNSIFRRAPFAAPPTYANERTALQSELPRIPGADRGGNLGFVSDSSEHLPVDADAHGVFLEPGEVSARQRVFDNSLVRRDHRAAFAASPTYTTERTALESEHPRPRLPGADRGGTLGFVSESSEHLPFYPNAPGVFFEPGEVSARQHVYANSMVRRDHRAAFAASPTYATGRAALDSQHRRIPGADRGGTLGFEHMSFYPGVFLEPGEVFAGRVHELDILHARRPHGAAQSLSSTDMDLRLKLASLKPNVNAPEFTPRPRSPLNPQATEQMLPHQLSAAPPPQRQIRHVWMHNWKTESAYISSLLDGRSYIVVGIDSEYAAPAPTIEQTGPPQSPEEWYSRLLFLANKGDLVQIGFAVQTEENTVAETFEINLFFNRSSRPYNKVTLKFLEDKAGHVLADHAKHGVLPELVSQWMRSNIHNLAAATVVMFQGDGDCAFLLRLCLQNLVIPGDRLQFLQILKRTLPSYFDVRVLGLHLLGRDPRGFSLDRLGEELGIQRLGRSHGSGSDALLTLDCFLHLKRNFGMAIQPLSGILCGLYATEEIVRSALPVHRENLKLVDVWSSNLAENSSFVLRSVESNFTTIALHAEFGNEQQFGWFEDDEYRRFRNFVQGASSATVTMATANSDGQLAGGLFYRFNICFDPSELGAANDRIPADRFHSKLLSHLLKENSVSWITYHGKDSVACIHRCIEPLPSSANEYTVSLSEKLQQVHDIASFTEDDQSSLHGMCEEYSVRTDKPNGEMEDDVILIMRCFLRILATTDPEVLHKKGYVLAKP